jgi:hypothetical protein
VSIVSVDRLVGIYRTAYQTIMQRLVDADARGTSAAFERRLLQDVAQILIQLDNDSREWIETQIPLIYQNGQQDAIRQLSLQGMDTDGLTARITGIHRSAVETIAENMYADLRAAERMVGRRIQDTIRQAGIEATARGLSTGETVRQRKKHLQDLLGQRGIQSITDQSGRTWRLDSYAEMVARTTQREATNLGSINQGVDAGLDLVVMSEHWPTCDICAQYQGRVYSVSGADSRFPSLNETAFGEGYSTIHPNCRHVVLPWVEQLATDAERQRYLDRSAEPFEDNRSTRELNAYRNEQRKKRWQYETRRMHERYSALLPNDTPPPGAFARMRQADSERWKELQGLYRDARRELRNRRFNGPEL